MVKPSGLNLKLFLIILFLIIWGLISVYSASAVHSAQIYGNPHYFFFKQLICVVVGLFLCLIIFSTRFEFFKHPLFVYSFLFFNVVLLFLTLNGPIIKGTQRWIRFGSFSLQPSEFSKLSIILFLAYYFSGKKEQVQKGLSGLLIPTICIGIILTLIIKQPDLGTAGLIIMISGIIFFVGGVKLRYIAVFITGFFTLLLGSFLFYDYAVKRIIGFLNYETDPLGKGFQIIQSLIALGSGGFTGVGLGDSTQKLYYLPDAHTDFIFSVVGEELGFLVTILIVIVFFMFFVECIKIARNSKDLNDALIVTGIASWITIQALINISVVTGLFPTKGIPLPFISSGGTSMIVLLISVGILMRISSGKQK